MSAAEPGGESRHVECMAFVARTPGLGRTTTVANIALILAGARARVLIVDWSAERPGADGYFARFGADPCGETEALAARFDELTRERRGRWQAARYQPPGDIEAIDLVAPRPLDGAGVPSLPWDDPIEDTVARLRAEIDASRYDYVLVDAPTDPDDDVIDVVARGVDQAVVLFEPSRPSVAGAADIADKIASRAVTGVRVLPLEVEPRDGGPPRRRVSAELVAEWFGDFLLDGEPPILRVPSVPERDSRQILVTLADDPGTVRVLAYARLAAELTRGAVTGPPALPAELRGNYRAALGMDDPRDTGRFTIVHRWPDRRYADWVRARLREGGAEAVLAGPDAVLSGAPAVAPGRAIWIVSERLLGALAGPLPDRPGDIALLVPGADAAAVPPVMRLIELDEGTPSQVGLRLLGRLGLVSEPARHRVFEPVFPLERDAGPLQTNFAPPARQPFAGRVAELTRLRDRLMSDTDGCEPYVLDGPPGIGKTAMVLEYLRLFRSDYRLIWWVSARTMPLVRSGLAELADALGVPARGDKAAAAVAELRASRGPWLLIYDDAEDLAGLADLIPSGGPGHVLVTARTAPETGPGAGTPYARDRLAALAAEPGAALLRERVAGLTAEQAQGVVAMLGGRPLALHLAAAWLAETADWLAARSVGTEEAAAWAAAEYTARVERHVAEGGPDITAACLALTLRTLEESGPLERLAVRLLEMCAWLSPEGVSHELLSTVPFLTMLEKVAGQEDGALIDADSMVLDQLLHICARYGLGRVLWKRVPLFRTHRSVQELIRGLLADTGEAEARNAQVLEAVGRTVPPVVDGPIGRHADRFAELLRHIGPLGAAERTEPWARRWFVEQMRFQYASGDEAGARELLALADRALARWPDDLVTARTLGQMANVCRVLGDFASASRNGERALTALRELGAAGEFWALAELRGRSADLRGLGRFAESLGEIQGVYEQFRRMFGDDHRETWLARINLAESAFLMGQYTLALRTAEAAWRQRTAEAGERDWTALLMARRVGDYLGGIGDWPRARRHLDFSLREARSMDTPNEIATLELMRSFAVAIRCDRGVDSGPPHKRITETLRGLRGLLGADHPSALATELSLGVELAMTGAYRAAVKRAERCCDEFASVYAPDHPIVQLCRVDLGVFTLEAGGAAKRALGILQDAGDALAETLGEQHPWTIVAALHQAWALAELGRADDARLRAEAARADALEFLGRDHPYTAAAGELLREGGAIRPVRERPRQARVYLDVPFI
ncbi:FxSxx-COOH system tetratricopeptide repeat protein [Actinomadura formosensis]|uniref:FxSxx-COOH system tetratricopeptide repeat protein n=1 Tax=Actinomadura formosensis TaxID=60706 RepID=UPI000AEB073E|nr:FxSxx-COOH system tetratricopeptide repeat protein [Actinomadura formosensis]